MGIRESFQENPPGEKDLNIHDIVIEEKKREELKFDPDAEIRKKDYEAMNRHLEFLYESSGNKVDPDAHDIRIRAGRLALAIKIIQEKGVNKNEVPPYCESTTIWPEPGQKGTVDEIQFFLRGTTPSVLEGRSWEEVETDLSQALPHREFSPRTNTWGTTSWYDFSYEAMLLKILYRDKDKEFNRLLNETMWDGMKSYLDEIRRTRQEGKNANNEEERFARLAMRMTILAAEEIIIDEHGIRLIMQKKKFRPEEKPKRPERRQF